MACAARHRCSIETPVWMQQPGNRAFFNICANQQVQQVVWLLEWNVELACTQSYMDRLATAKAKKVPWVCRLFYKFGRQHNAALRQWYSFGVAVAAMLGMSVIFMLLQDVWLAVVWIREVCHLWCRSMRCHRTFLDKSNTLSGQCSSHCTLAVCGHSMLLCLKIKLLASRVTQLCGLSMQMLPYTLCHAFWCSSV